MLPSLCGPHVIPCQDPLVWLRNKNCWPYNPEIPWDKKQEIKGTVTNLKKKFLLRNPLFGNILYTKGVPGSSDGKESACKAGDLGSILESGICPGEGNGNPLQYYCLENSMDRGAWWVTDQGGSQKVGHDWVANIFILYTKLHLVSENLFFQFLAVKKIFSSDFYPREITSMIPTQRFLFFSVNLHISVNHMLSVGKQILFYFLLHTWLIGFLSDIN